MTREEVFKGYAANSRHWVRFINEGKSEHLRMMFYWADKPEGHEYWRDICCSGTIIKDVKTLKRIKEIGVEKGVLKKVVTTEDLKRYIWVE